MNNRILLIHPAFAEGLNFFPSFQKVESIEPPPGLAYILAPLRKAGVEIDFIDNNVEAIKLDDFNERVRRANFVGVSCYSESFHNAMKTIRLTRKANPKCKILAGGPLCRLTGEYVFGSDVTVAGEAEHLIVPLIERLSSGKMPNDLEGMRFMRDGKLVSTLGNPRVLEEQMNVGRTVYDAKKFLAEGRDYGSFMGFRIKGLSGTNTSRGCPFACKFCAHRGRIDVDKRIRYRKVSDVIEELGAHAQDGGRWVIFYDENATAHPKRSRELMQAIIDERFGLNIILQSRATSANDELYELERRAGVKLKMFGIESANQDVLDFHDKRATVKHMENAIKMADKHRMLAFGYFILGSPVETREHFENNLRFIDRVPLSAININVLGYYPGSILHAEAVENGWVQPGETRYADEKISNYSFAQWNAMKGEMLKRFYSPRRIAGNLVRATRAGILGTVAGLFLSSGKSFVTKAANPFYDAGLDKMREN